MLFSWHLDQFQTQRRNYWVVNTACHMETESWNLKAAGDEGGKSVGTQVGRSWERKQLSVVWEALSVFYKGRRGQDSAEPGNNQCWVTQCWVTLAWREVCSAFRTLSYLKRSVLTLVPMWPDRSNILTNLHLRLFHNPTNFNKCYQSQVPCLLWGK